jgi:Spy/CpxP family protein refolding chaperone
MKKTDKDFAPIEKLLEKWEVPTVSQPDLKQRILRRIAVNEAEEGSKIPSWLAFWPPFSETRALALALSCMVLLVAAVSVIAFHERKMRMDAEFCSEYFLSIDPVAQVQSLNESLRPDNGKEPSIVEKLGWMKDRLSLSREQFAQMVDLHRNYSDKFAALYSELRDIDGHYRIFENSRINDEAIDFMALYDLLQKRDALRIDSETTSKELVGMINSILTPEQSIKFMSLFSKERISHENNSPATETHAGA